MQLTLNRARLMRRAVFMSISVLPLTVPALAQAESAYVQQAGPTAGQNAQPVFAPGQIAGQTVVVPVPELTTPATRNANLAQSLTIGNINTVAQIQTGVNDRSTVGVLGGMHTNVGVLQAGSNLRSNVALLGTQGLNVTVLQANGAAPLNMLIARLPTGGLLIKR